MSWGSWSKLGGVPVTAWGRAIRELLAKLALVRA